MTAVANPGAESELFTLPDGVEINGDPMNPRNPWAQFIAAVGLVSRAVQGVEPPIPHDRQEQMVAAVYGAIGFGSVYSGSRHDWLETDGEAQKQFVEAATGRLGGLEDEADQRVCGKIAMGAIGSAIYWRDNGVSPLTTDEFSSAVVRIDFGELESLRITRTV